MRSVWISNWLNSERAWENENQFKVMRRLTDMVNPAPANTFVILDERDRINNGFFVVEMKGFIPRRPAAVSMVDCPASYHVGAGGLTFADGYAQIKKMARSAHEATHPEGEKLGVDCPLPE